MKSLRVLFYAVWFMLAAMSLAHAGPVAAAVGAIASSIGAMGALGQFVLGVALKVGLSLLERARQKGQEPRGVQGQIQVGGDNPLSFIVGTYATAGSLEYVNTWGKAGKTPNAYLTQVISLSDLPVTSVSNAFWTNGEKTVAELSDTSYGDWGFPIYAYRKDGDNNHYWWKSHLGNETVADSLLVREFGSDSQRPWSADMIGRGIAYVVITAQVEEELFTGPPQCKFEVQGIRLYDPRKDSTVGGSGSHRWSDPSTWEFSDNPAVVIYNILRGIYYNGQWMWGGQVPLTRLPLSNWFAAMNECDRLVPGAEVPTEKQFRCGAEIRLNEEPLDVIERLLKVCNGKMAEIGGVYKIRVGAPGLPVYAFTDESIAITSSQSYEPFPGLETIYNGVNVTYPDPDAAWENKEAPPRYFPEYEAEDDNRRLMADVQFEYSPFRYQNQRLGKALVETNRRFRSHKFTLPPEAVELEPLDVVSWSSVRNGYENKLFDMESMDDLENVNQSVAIREVDPSDYNWTPATDELPTSVGYLGPIRPLPQPIIDFYADRDIAQDANGNNRRCAILLGWDPEQPAVDLVMYEVRAAWNLKVIYVGRTERVSEGSIQIAPGTLLPAQSYEVRARYATYAGNRPFEWSDWIPVTMYDIRLGPLDIYPIDIDQLNQDVQRNLEWIGDSFRYVQEELDRIGAQATEQDSANYTDKQTLRREMSVTAEGLKASYTEAIEVAIGPGSAIVTRIESLEAVVNDPVTGLEATAGAVDLLQVQVSTMDGVLTATANAVTGLTATVGNFSASGLFRTTVEATPGGALARIGLSVSASGGGSTSQAAIFLDALTGGQSRVVINADQFIVTNGTNSQAPLTFIAGGLALQVANIGDVTAGILRSPDNQVVFNLAAKTLIFSDNT
ncbi:phage tail protein [Brucella lupini]|uniref:Phage tail family protein n=2 Tax=Brucella lupini TaxID=255457 RepID=A0A256GGR3_9HYPH|nr:phage tail protein [Brucella lupini]OYR26289.1 phage tail family protein [Brucella lupini]